MDQNGTSNVSVGFAILLVLVLILAGALAFGLLTNNLGTSPLGALVGFLIGIAILSTIEYASARIRRN